ncbi:MAG TPA: hypothetical protein VII99_07430 [Bacteroidia bacterium]
MRVVKNLSDWKIKRDKIDLPTEGITHALWETDNEEFGFYFYEINEYGILKNFCRLQILRDKTNPKILYDSKKVSFIYNPYDKLFTEYDWTDKGLLVLRQILDRGFKAPVIIINLYNLTFVSLDKFYVKLSLDNKILTTDETFYDKPSGKEKVVTENFDFDKIEWLSLQNLV